MPEPGRIGDEHSEYFRERTQAESDYRDQLTTKVKEFEERANKLPEHLKEDNAWKKFWRHNGNFYSTHTYDSIEEMESALWKLEATATAQELYDEGVALSEQGLYEDALEKYSKIPTIMYAPKQAKLFSLNNKGFVLEKLNRDEEALEAYNDALEIDSNYNTAKKSRNDLLKRLGRKK